MRKMWPANIMTKANVAHEAKLLPTPELACLQQRTGANSTSGLLKEFTP